jgi:recombinational DNA repair protein RecR
MGQQLDRTGESTRTSMGAPLGSDIEHFDELTTLKAIEGG